MWYYRARWYDAETGQFLSEDPLGFAAGDANLKRYVFNSPPNWTDPSGLSGGGTGGEGGDGGGSDVYNPYGPSGGYWPSFYSPWYPIPHPVPDFSMEVQDAINNILNMQVGDTNVDGNVNWQFSGPPGWTLGTNTPFGPGSWLTTGIAGTGNNIVQTNIGLQYHVPNFTLTTQLQNSHQNVVGLVAVQGSGFGGGTASVVGGASGSGWNPADWDYVWQIGQSNQIVDLQGTLIPGVETVQVVSSVTYGNISPAQPGQPIDPGRPTANWNMNMNIQLNPLWGFNPFSQITIGVTTPIHSGSSPNFNIIFER